VLELIDYPTDLSPIAFRPVAYQGAEWDLSHLKSFAFKVGLGVQVDVVVIFSCHCFTHGVDRDPRELVEIPSEEIYRDGREVRVLDPRRYSLSRDILHPLVHRLPAQKIVVANDSQRNFLTREMGVGDERQTYAIFFDVEKDRDRAKRLILRVQSAYLLTSGLTRRQEQAKKVGWHTLLKAAYEGRKIRP